MITNMGKVNHLRRLRRALLTAQAEAHEVGEYLAAHRYGEAQPGRGICGDCSAKLEDAVEKSE